MPFPTYSKETLLNFAISTLRNRLDVNPTPGTMWYKLADAWSDVLLTMSGHQQYVEDQILPTTAETEVLERHARMRGLSRKNESAAFGKVHITLVEE